MLIEEESKSFDYKLSKAEEISFNQGKEEYIINNDKLNNSSNSAIGLGVFVFLIFIGIAFASYFFDFKSFVKDFVKKNINKD